mgnify:CR=1 FL=1
MERDLFIIRSKDHLKETLEGLHIAQKAKQNESLNQVAYANIIQACTTKIIHYMKDELKSFLKKQLNNESDNQVIGMDSFTDSNFSNFK